MLNLFKGGSTCLIGTTATGLGLTVALNGDLLLASDAVAKPAPLPWWHEGIFHTFDHASIRH